MNKLTSYVVVGVASAMTTLGGSYLINKSENGSIITDADTNKSNFSSVDYKGNYALNAPDFVEASQRTVNAVVSIKNFSNQTQPNKMSMEDFFFGFPQQQQRDPDQPTGLGSGVIISQDGYIVTNNHVIKDADKIEVTLNNQKTFTAELVGTDPSTDVALLKIEAASLPYLKFIDSDQINVGDWVLAVGNPFGLNSTVTAGIVSAKARNINLLGKNSDSPVESFIQTDAAINPGNSGGALVNANGDLVGINTGIASQTGSYTGYGFAVPSNLVKKVVDDIKQYGMVQRGFLGIKGFDLSNEEMVKSYNKKFKTKLSTQEGIYIEEVTNNGGAIDAGLEKGDIITSIDGKPVKTFGSLTFIVGSKNPGDKVNVNVLRDGKTRSYNVVLKDQKGNSKIRNKSDLTISEKLGAEFDPLTEKQKISFGIDYGVITKNVTSSGKLASLGIDDNFIILKINEKEVKSESDVEKLLKNHTGKVSISFVDQYGRMYTRGFVLD